ncbi:MAG: NAD-dependent epimerase/dehydratase family protein [Nitrososphaeria archaeon]
MKVLVTGSSGFVGKHLVDALKNEGHSVFGADVKDIRKKVDVRSLVAVEELFRSSNPDRVVHLAALISPPESMVKPIMYIRNNVMGTVNVLEASRKFNIKKIIYFSSAAVYGEPQELPLKESSPTVPLNPYGASKLMSENAVEAYSRSYGLEYVIFRPSNIYGVGQNPSYAGVMHAFAEAIANGRNPVIFGDGNQTRDFIHITDVVDAVMKALKSDVRSAVLNLSSGNPATVNLVAELFKRAYGRDIRFIYAPPRNGDIYRSELCNDLIKKTLNWVPKMEFKDGVKEILDWHILEHGSNARHRSFKQ